MGQDVHRYQDDMDVTEVWGQDLVELQERKLKEKKASYEQEH